MKPIILDEYENEEMLEEPLMEQDPPEGEGNKTGNENPGGEGEEGGDIFGGGEEGGEEPEYSLTDIGRVYILKKIYESLRQLLDYANDIQNVKPSKRISKLISDIVQARDLFVVLGNNIDKYLDRLDSIIDQYRKFIKISTDILYKYAEENDLIEKSKK